MASDLDPARSELQAAPPFWTWKGLYCLLAGVLLAEIVLFTVLTFVYR
jgi:hypothetical protein